MSGAEKEKLLGDDIHEFVWKRMDAEFAKGQEKMRDLERNIEQAVRLKYLEERVVDLGEHMKKLGKRYGKEHELYLKTKERLEEAEKTAEAIRSTRMKLAA